MKTLAAALIAIAAAAQAAEPPLIVYYNERPQQHYTNQQGTLEGPAADKVIAALKAAGIPYQIRPTPAKQQLVLLRENRERACMMSWVDIPGRDKAGKLSAVIYQEPASGYQRRLWCTMAVPDEVMQRLNAALRR